MTYGYCSIHGKFKQEEWHDFQCPKCEKEVLDYGRFAGQGYKKEDLTKDAKRLIKRVVADLT